MTERSSIEGYAIVSTDGMIADRNRQMPDGLKIDADVRHFNDGLDRAALIVHGRHSHEQQAVSDRRRRLVVTRAIPALGRPGSGIRQDCRSQRRARQSGSWTAWSP